MKFFDKYGSEVNLRQKNGINRMLEEGSDGFKGGMTAKKYIGVTKTSKANATRDLMALKKMGAFRNEGSGRSTHYYLNL